MCIISFYNRLTVTRHPQSIRAKRVDVCGRDETGCKRSCHNKVNNHEQIYPPKYEDTFSVPERRCESNILVSPSMPK